MGSGWGVGGLGGIDKYPLTTSFKREVFAIQLLIFERVSGGFFLKSVPYFSHWEEHSTLPISMNLDYNNTFFTSSPSPSPSPSPPPTPHGNATSLLHATTSFSALCFERNARCEIFTFFFFFLKT